MDDTATKRSALMVAALASFNAPFMGSSINIALPVISEQFGIDAVMLGWIATSYLLASAMFLLPFGRAADIFGRKKIFTYGMVIFTIGSCLSALSVSASMLIACRVLQGIGSSMTFGTAVAILTSVYPVGERGKAMGISVASVYTGLSLGPFLGGFLTQHFGWRSIFLVVVLLGLLTLVTVLWKLPGEWAGARGEKLDYPGSIVYGLSLVLLMIGFAELPGVIGFSLLVCGLVSAFVFFWWESKTDSPIFNVRVFRNNTVFTFSNLAALIHYSSTFGVTFLMSLFLQFAKGLSPQNAGFVLVCQPIMMALFSPLAGRISDRIEPRVVASLGMGMTAAALFLLTVVGLNTSLGYIIACLMLLGLGFALFSSPNTNAVMSSVEARFLGVASGTLGTMRLVGQMLSMGLVMMIMALMIGKTQITPENCVLFIKALKIALSIFGVLCVCGVFASLARGKMRPA